MAEITKTFTEGQRIPVKLELLLRAKNLLLEEFPLSEEGVRQEDGRWFYEGEGGKLEGVGRFCIGLAGDVKVVDSPQREACIKEYVNKNFK